MVRVWLYGGGTMGASLADLLQSDEMLTYCSPGSPGGLQTQAYAEEEIGFALDRLGSIDALVFQAQRETGRQVIEAVIRTTSDFLACTREAVRSMTAQGTAGNLVCVSDIAGVAGRSGRATAACASGALLGMVRALSKELGRQQISVNALACGPKASPGQDADELTAPEAQLFAAMGVGQPLRLEELAATLGLLVRGGHGMTGQVLHLDHGLVI